MLSSLPLPLHCSFVVRFYRQINSSCKPHHSAELIHQTYVIKMVNIISTSFMSVGLFPTTKSVCFRYTLLKGGPKTDCFEGLEYNIVNNMTRYIHFWHSSSAVYLHYDVSTFLPPPRRWCFRRCFLFVCLLSTLRKNFGTDLHEIFREGWQWANERLNFDGDSDHESGYAPGSRSVLRH